MKKWLQYAVHAIWAAPVALVLRVLKSIVRVRLAVIESSRIGHFIADTSIFFARRVSEPDRRVINVFWMPQPTANRQWERMVRRSLGDHPWVRYVAAINRRLPGGRDHEIASPSMSGDRREYAALRQTSARMLLTPAEEAEAQRWMQRRGWKPGERFVCLHVRDSAYLRVHPTHAAGSADRWSYHNYRDTDIADYVDVARQLLDRGYWVVRTGKIAHREIPLKNDRLIDYPFSQDQDDLLDIWFGMRCTFFVSTASGIDTLAWVYGVPAAYVNALPLFLSATPTHHIWVPKHLRWRSTGSPLTLREHCRHAYGETAEYERAGIDIVDLSPDEITAAALELERRVNGTQRDTDEDLARQRRYWEVIKGTPGFTDFHDYVHTEARVGQAWLRSMGDEFLS